MGCLRSGHSFSGINVLEDLYLFFLATMIAVWTMFEIDRAFNCEPTVMYTLADPPVAALIVPCNVYAKDKQVNAAMTTVLVMGGIYLLAFLLLNAFRPFDVHVVARPLRHCHSCRCEHHMTRPGELHPLSNGGGGGVERG